MLLEVVLPMLAYRLRPTRERLARAAKPILTEPDDLVARQLGAVYRHVRLDTGLPRMATTDELANFEGPVAVFASEKDPFFPAREVLARAEEVFPGLIHTECLDGCRHIPSESAFGRVNESIRVFLEGPGET